MWKLIKINAMKRLGRERYNPTWHLLAEDDSVIHSMSEAQIKTSGIMVSPECDFSRQWEIIANMEVGEVALCRKVSNNYSVQDLTHTFNRIKRVA